MGVASHSFIDLTADPSSDSDADEAAAEHVAVAAKFGLNLEANSSGLIGSHANVIQRSKSTLDDGKLTQTEAGKSITSRTSTSSLTGIGNETREISRVKVHRQASPMDRETTLLNHYKKDAAVAASSFLALPKKAVLYPLPTPRAALTENKSTITTAQSTHVDAKQAPHSSDRVHALNISQTPASELRGAQKKGEPLLLGSIVSDEGSGVSRPAIRHRWTPFTTIGNETQSDTTNHSKASDFSLACKRTATGDPKHAEHFHDPSEGRITDAISSTVRATPSRNSPGMLFGQLQHSLPVIPPASIDISSMHLQNSTEIKQADLTQSDLTQSSTTDSLNTKLSVVMDALKKESIIPSEAEIDRVKCLIGRADRGAVHGGPYRYEDDELLIYLKERVMIPWPLMIDFFPGRNTWHSLQSRYSAKLKNDRNIARIWISAKVHHLSPEQMPPHAASSIHTNLPRKSSRLENSELTRPGAFSAFTLGDAQQTVTDPTDSEDDSSSLEISSADYNLQHSVQDLGYCRQTGQDQKFRRFNNHLRASRYSSGKSDENKPSRLDHNLKRRALNQFNMESVRDAAALSSMVMKINRPPAEDIPMLLSNWGPKRSFRMRKRSSVDVNRPYLDWSERRYLSHSVKTDAWEDQEIVDWEGKILHVDFLDEEIEQLVPSIQAYRRHALSKDYRVREWVFGSMANASEDEILHISGHMISHGVFLNRTRDSINSFLRDISRNRQSHLASFRRIGLKPAQDRTSCNLTTCLRNRELGMCKSRRLTSFYEMLGPSLVFTGGSGDVQTVAWAQDGETFAVGCAALMDAHSQQYNEKNNLLIGDSSLKTIRELPDHALARKLTSFGANSNMAMHAVQDPLVFSTISAIEFSPDGGALFSAGYDHKVRIWDLRGDNDRMKRVDNARCVVELQHRARVAVLAVSAIGLFATGAERSKGSVKVMRHDVDIDDLSSLLPLTLSSPRAQESPGSGMSPSCLRWGCVAGHQQDYLASQAKYLACGFSSWASEHDVGETCIWDVEVGQATMLARGTRNVFDVAWSPSSPGRLAIGGMPNGNVNKGTRSVVRIYDSRWTPSSLGLNAGCTVELECSAKDMNDLSFNPADELLVSTGCTDGAIYTWDLRKPDILLHTFKHKPSLMPLDDIRSAEDIDTGVRFLSWNQKSKLLYTGSSDGIVNAWNPYVAPENACVRKVVELESGIMSGAFSPDFSSLLLGEVKGSIALLSLGFEDRSMHQAEQFAIRTADEGSLAKVRTRAGVVGDGDSQTPGIDAARAMLRAHEMQIVPFGDLPTGQAVQGVNYKGPFDLAIDAPMLRDSNVDFQRKFNPSKEPCTLHCSLSQLTEEEQGDSKFWKERIPEHLRWGSEHTKVVSHLMAQDMGVQNLICFRCNQCRLIPVTLPTGAIDDVLRCTQCQHAWRFDVLGYTLVDYETLAPMGTPTYTATAIKPKNEIAAIADDEDSLGNVMTYHHLFWGGT